MIEFYCLQCKHKVMKFALEVEQVIMKNGQPAVTAFCPIHTTIKMYKIGALKPLERNFYEKRLSYWLALSE